MGTISFTRKYGTEVWKITSSEFSISPNQDSFKINIWVESDHEVLEKINETGDTSTAIEIVFPLQTIPNFSELFTFKMPKWAEVKENWGEAQAYYCNWYYFEHRDVEDIEIQIHKTTSNKFKVHLKGIVEDPTDASTELNTLLNIEVETALKNELNGYWAE